MLTKEQCDLLYKQSASNKELSDKIWQEASTGMPNQIGDAFWYIQIVSTVDNDKIWDWSNWLRRYELPSYLLEHIQEVCLAYIGGYTNPNTGKLVQASGNFKKKWATVFQLYNWFYVYENDPKKWIELTTEQIKEVVWGRVDKHRKDLKVTEKNTGKTIARAAEELLRWFRDNPSYSLFSEEELIPLYTRKSFSKDWLKKNDLTFDEFYSSTHHLTIPHHISMKWIVWIIEQFNTEEFIFHALFMPEITRQYKSRKYDKDPTVIEGGLGTIIKKGITGNEAKDNRWNHVDKASLLLKTAKKHFKKELSLDDISSLFKRYFPKNTGIHMFSSLSNYLSHVYAAIILLNGARKSEVNTLCLSDFKKITDEHSEYTSLIHKTANGLSTVRSISGYVYDLVMKVRQLGGKDRMQDGVGFWNVTSKRTSNKYDDHGDKLFDRSYQVFLDSISKEDSDFIRAELPSVTPHMGRHTFFGMCLRLGDQNAYEKINEHARHQVMSYMTRQYTEGKRDEMQRLSIEKEFISEMVCNLVEEKDLGYFGPQYKVLSSLIDQEIEFYDVNDKDQIEELGYVIADKYDRIKVNETGLCMPRKDTLDQSKCWNGEFPDYEEGSLFVNCSGCIHNFCQRGHKEAIERHLISVSDMLDNAPLLGGKLRKKYEQELQQGEKLLAMADKQND